MLVATRGGGGGTYITIWGMLAFMFEIEVGRTVHSYIIPNIQTPPRSHTVIRVSS